MAAAITHRFVVLRQGQARGHHGSVMGGQAVVTYKARGHVRGQLRHGRTHLRNPLGRDDQGRQVRIGKVAVIVRVFLGAHGPCFTSTAMAVGVEEHGGLFNRQAVFNAVNLPLHFAVNGQL